MYLCVNPPTAGIQLFLFECDNTHRHRGEEKHINIYFSFPPSPANAEKMSDALCILGSFFGSADGQQDCTSCYMINIGSVMGIIATDIILTIFITITVFFFASHQSKRRDPHDGRRSQLPSISRKMAAEVSESPYQELHGVQSDVYSELRHFRK